MEAILSSVLLHGLVPEGFCPPGETVELISTDSRQLQPGCIFVAFPGEKFDGHDFAAKALERGARYVVLNHPVEGVPADRTVLCENSYRAVLTMGTNYRAQYHPRVVGITGSVGKTTTKQMCYAAIAPFGETIKTEGSQNNELGVPRTMWRLAASTEYAVIEMGMNHAGEISRLTRCARPDVGVITCIGTSHIGNLESRENILKAKLEICEGMPDGAPLVLNGDDALLRAAALPAHVRPVWFAREDAAAEVTARDVRQEGPTLCFTVCDRAAGRYAVRLPDTLGLHNVLDALAAYTAATRLGLDPARAAAALEDFRQTGLRGKVVQCAGVALIEDCYNANPDSMKAALKTLKNYPAKHRIAVLGDMLELGEFSAEAHEEAGREAVEAGISVLIVYGAESERIAAAAEQAAPELYVVRAATHQQAADALRALAGPGDAVLLKASHGMHLETVAELFEKSASED